MAGKYKVTGRANSLEDIMTVHNLITDLKDGKAHILGGYALIENVTLGLNIEKAT